jgi:hypothetical protein
VIWILSRSRTRYYKADQAKDALLQKKNRKKKARAIELGSINLDFDVDIAMTIALTLDKLIGRILRGSRTRYKKEDQAKDALLQRKQNKNKKKRMRH